MQSLLNSEKNSLKCHVSLSACLGKYLHVTNDNKKKKLKKSLLSSSIKGKTTAAKFPLVL